MRIERLLMGFYRNGLTSLPVILLTICIFFSGSAILAQTGTTSPDRGMKLGNAYSIGEFDTVNTTNGNLMFNFSLGALPAGRGTASTGLNLIYNSKLYDSKVQKIRDERYPECSYLEDSPEPQECRYFYKTILDQSGKGGWRYSFGQYELEFENRNSNYGPSQPNCRGYMGVQNSLWREMTWIHKLRIVTPDGSSHEMLPSGYTNMEQLDKFYRVTHDGYIENCGGGRTRTGHGMTYYSDDGSYLRLTFSYDYDNNPDNNTWTLHFPDGSKVTSGVFPSEGQRIYDRNGNYVEGLTDQLGRSISFSYGTAGEDEVKLKGVDGEEFIWKVKWKAIMARKGYQSCSDGDGSCPVEHQRSQLDAYWPVVDKITLPEQMGGQSYTFHYNAPEYQLPLQPSYGWGEVSGVTLPTGAEISYSYLWDGQDGPTDVSQTKDLLKNYPQTKSINHDGQVDTWGYGTSTYGGSVTDPSGNTTANYFTNTEEISWLAGLTYKTVSDNGTMTENIWARNVPAAQSVGWYFSGNPYIKTQFTSIKDSTGNYALTAIKDYTYDKNGNVTEVKEFDYLPYSSIPRNQYGENPTMPSGIAPARISRTEYYNPTPTAASSTYTDPDSYHEVWSKRLLRLVKSTEIQDGSGSPKSRSEVTYDYTTYDSGNTNGGNPTVTMIWDSFKNGIAQPYSNPLTAANSISTTAQYDQYGNPVLTTDAKGVQTQITYGDIVGPNGTVSGLYPTQTVSAYGTGVARTSVAVYDFYTGLVTSATDVDNGVTSATEYDALGRPVKSIAAVGTPLEVWTQTEYDDINRRVIVRSDLEIKGDGKKVAVQHYDQLGRVRLSRTLENAATEDPYNETHGIKVQTRYQTGNPNSYQLTSNPFRAATATAATNEPTMGWTRSMSVNTGRHAETETFSGASLPAPWGSNTNSTGKIQTDNDADRTLVTDQAGKQRISKTNALGQLKDIWEITAQDSSTVSVTFPNTSIGYGYHTSYNYDTLNNLTTVNQGVQTRTFSYSSLSRLLTAANPESGTINYGYDLNGNLTTKTDARNITTAYNYDALNRVTFRDYSDTTPDVTYTYDNLPNAKGRLIKVSSSISSTEYTAFDILGHVTAHKQTTDGTAYTTGYVYNLSGALIEETYPSGRVVKNVLDNEGDLSMVQSKKSAAHGYWNYAQNFTYNAAGAVTSMQLGNGRWESTQFNSRLQPTQIALGTVQNGTDKLKLDYEYGALNPGTGQVIVGTNNGNVAKQKITVPTVGQNPGFTAQQYYAYDSLNRLQIATENIENPGEPITFSWRQQFTFDRHGNRRFDEPNTTTIPQGCQTPVCNPTIDPATNRLVGYTFDNGGNTTVDAEGRTFIYDAENKQVQVNNGQGIVGEYFYNGDGQRVKKVVPSSGETTVFVYDVEGKMIAEYSTQLSQTPQVSYLTHDHLGSPRILTDENGNVISRRDFRPFGEEIMRAGYGQDSVREKFATYERDEESGLDYAQARYYSANLGRFFSIDPENADAEQEVPQSWNAYSYARNNPLKYGDPSGEGVEVCTTSGERQCTNFTEKQWKNFLEINKESGEYTVKGNKVFINGSDEVAFVITSSSFLTENQMGFIRTTADQSIKKAKVVGTVAAVVAVTTAACAVTAGGGCVAAAGAVLREGVRSASPAAIQALASGLRFTGTTALRQASAARRVPLHTLAAAILTGQRMADPQRAQGAIKIVQEMWKNGVKYRLEIVYREADKTILHFLYKRQ